jgi:hypothetical protein
MGHNIADIAETAREKNTFTSFVFRAHCAQTIWAKAKEFRLVTFCHRPTLIYKKILLKI